MKQAIKAILKGSPLYHPLRNRLVRQRHVKELEIWERNSRPCPPPHAIKQRALKACAETYGLRILVETGTYLGDMVQAMRDTFDYIYSIELSEELFRAAARRFARAKHIEIIQGDSGVELGNLIPRIRQPALFWLDGHYSAGITARGQKDSPIFEELNHILHAPDLGHVIVVDDARCFGVEPGYPSLEALREHVLSLRSGINMTVEDDIIRLVPLSGSSAGRQAAL